MSQSNEKVNAAHAQNNAINRNNSTVFNSVDSSQAQHNNIQRPTPANINRNGNKNWGPPTISGISDKMKMQLPKSSTNKLSSNIYQYFQKEHNQNGVRKQS